MIQIPLLDLDDPRWAHYSNGYRLVSDEVVPLIRELQRVGASADFWQRAWDELHHQGDVGEAILVLRLLTIPQLAHRV